MEYASIHAAVRCLLAPYKVFLTTHFFLAIGCWPIHLRKVAQHVPFSVTHSAQLTGEDSYQIAIMNTQGIRVEIVSDGPPPPEEAP